MVRRQRERGEIGADDVDHADLQPVDLDLEPVELEPVDRADVRAERRSDTRRNDRRRVALLAAVVTAVAASVFVAVNGSAHHAPHAAPRPAPAATTGTSPTFESADPISTLVRRLQPYWPDGEAMVMFGRLYITRSRDRQPALVGPAQPAVIEDQSGSSLLLSTFPELLVATEPRIASRVLSPQSVAVRATEPDEWWIVTGDGDLRDSVSGSVLHPPGGLHVVAAVPHGFVALDVRHSQWVVWSGEPSTRPIIDSQAQLVVARGPTIVFRSGCTNNGCSLEIFDLARHSTVRAYVPGVPDFAVFSPTGNRLALASSPGDVFLMDPATGDMIAHTRSRVLPSLSSPVAWSSDGERLIVVQNDSVEVRNATTGRVSDVITGTTGLEQLAGLP
jgi:hypothetical protein